MVGRSFRNANQPTVTARPISICAHGHTDDGRWWEEIGSESPRWSCEQVVAHRERGL